MDFKMGQYAFIHIWNLSLYEWHPFTIASGENESECYMQIQNEGLKLSEMAYGGGNSELAQNAQFTNLLYALAQSSSSSSGQMQMKLEDIELHVDGPYGSPFVYDGYDRIV